jgi:heptosyltransferase-2
MYKNILVHALVNIGDVVLTTGAIALLKKTYPYVRITMMVRPFARQLVENNPVIDEVLIYNYKSKGKSLAGTIAMIKEIRQRKFDASISFDRKLRPALLTWLAGIPVRVGPSKVFDNKPSRVTWLFNRVIHIEYDLHNNLQAEAYQNIIRGFTGQGGSAKPVLARLKPENEKKAAELLSQLPQGERRVALCIKGTFPLKTWPKERFIEVVHKLAGEFACTFCVVGAPGDREYADELIREVQLPVANFCGKTDLMDLVALLKNFDLFLTVDTGAAHIAATVDVPMVVVYGCTSPVRWHPLSDKATALCSAEPCRPCQKSAEECPTPNCLANVTVPEVLAACVSHLTKGRECG